jgi:hypothetical protein
MQTERHDAYEAAALACGLCVAFARSTLSDDVEHVSRMAEAAIMEADAFCYRGGGRLPIGDPAANQARAAVSAALRGSWAVAARRFLRAARLSEVAEHPVDRGNLAA